MAATVEAKRGSSTSTTPRSAKQQHAGVEIVGAERRGERAALLVPGAVDQGGVDRLGDRIPIFGAIGEPDAVGDRRQPLTAGPAHRRRMGVDARAAAIFPDAGVGLERLLGSAVTERFQQMKQPFVARPRQAAVEEHRHGGENDAAIGVVLDLIDRGIADAHRAVAAIAFEIGRGAFVDAGRRHDAVDRTQLMVRLRCDRQRERNELLHGARGADAVERLDDEISVAQPAIAVIPGAARRRRLGDRRGVRGDDAAGLVEIGEFQRDRGADDRFLPIVRDRQAAHPFHPIVAGALGKFAAGLLQIAGIRLVGTEHQMQRPGQHERRFAFDQRQRRVRRQADHGRVRWNSGCDCCRANDWAAACRSRRSAASAP